MHIKNFDPYDFSKKEIDGVPVYYKNIPWAPCINIRVVFNIGAFNDPVGKEGLSHFLEHMIFDGSPTLPDKKAIKLWSKINALNSWTAWTNFYSTTYSLKCLPEKYEDALVGAKDMIFNSLMRSEDVEHERKVIIQEAWGRFKNEKYLDYIKEVKSIVSPNHDFGRFNTPLGWPVTINNISADDVISWHKQKYGKGNFFIVITGAVDDSHVEKLGDFVSGLDIAMLDEFKEGVIEKPTKPKLIKNADEIGETMEQVEISFIRMFRKIKINEDGLTRLSRNMLYDLLFERLRIDNSLCYGVGVNITRDINYSMAAVTVKTEEKNIDLVEKEVQGVIGGIIGGSFEEPFKMIKKNLIDQIKSQELLSGEITGNAQWSVSIYGEIPTLSDEIAEIENVSYKDVSKFVSELFDMEHVFTQIILPSKK